MARLVPRRCASVVPLLVITFVLACSGATRTDRSSLGTQGRVYITEEQIVQSGATTAWDAIRRNAPQLHLVEKRSGDPAKIDRRGRSSIYLNDDLVLMVDGVRMTDIRNLDLIPAHTIFSIVILTGIEGTTYYGTNAVNGVILISTKSD